jgi:hypothetical protein
MKRREFRAAESIIRFSESASTPLSIVFNSFSISPIRRAAESITRFSESVSDRNVLSFSLKLISSQAVGMGNPPWNAGFPNELADVANGCCVQLPVTHRCKVGAPAPVPQFYCVEGGKIAGPRSLGASALPRHSTISGMQAMRKIDLNLL